MENFIHKFVNWVIQDYNYIFAIVGILVLIIILKVLFSSKKGGRGGEFSFEDFNLMKNFGIHKHK